MTPTQRILVQILATLAVATGCDNKDDDDSGDEEVGEAGSSPTEGLEELDVTEYPVCTGDSLDTGGSECCVDVWCVPPDGDSCPAPDAQSAEDLTGMSLGSGACLCAAVEGPFAVESDAGQCCYTLGIEGCEGRPLIVDGTIRRAPVQARRGWTVRAA